MKLTKPGPLTNNEHHIESVIKSSSFVTFIIGLFDVYMVCMFVLLFVMLYSYVLDPVRSFCIMFRHTSVLYELIFLILINKSAYVNGCSCLQ